MQLKNLFKTFDKLQKLHGHKRLDAIYGAGEIKNPNLFLVFMNPTARNIASNKKWSGLKAPWIGTKNVWKMFYQLGFINKKLFDEINKRKPDDWDYNFAKKTYQQIKKKSIYITNLSKATQIDARPLKNNVFRKYLNLFKEEILTINPKIIITFGNQVSSIILGSNIKVSDYRKKYKIMKIHNKEFKIFPVYYPIGQGTRNIDKAKEDIDWIINNIPNQKTSATLSRVAKKP